jgi:hypothetical protein
VYSAAATFTLKWRPISLDKPSTEGQELKVNRRIEFRTRLFQTPVLNRLVFVEFFSQSGAVASQLVQGQGSIQHQIKLYQGRIHILLVVYFYKKTTIHKIISRQDNLLFCWWYIL